MMPIVDKPLIQFAVEEAVAAGITDMIFVTGRSKRSIEDHFDKAYELESELEIRGKTAPQATSPINRTIPAASIRWVSAAAKRIRLRTRWSKYLAQSAGQI
jgi:UTP-glucose-1-phosphate uridylyltransferase